MLSCWNINAVNDTFCSKAKVNLLILLKNECIDNFQYLYNVLNLFERSVKNIVIHCYKIQLLNEMVSVNSIAINIKKFL